ncbi:Aste57867_21420 [Aphanomyces stellatus]|uniref:Aste57867_21420 protein n=1 Tax=Aphanomyces stellatus TaxID=120398 RepID=A0A485LHF1_9STRA|nr:hypothetical protein As57867_021351 [Aphanomyces stellatus]VFT98091.1 Aste57867_21420 [Aphanomyces stellatus]
MDADVPTLSHAAQEARDRKALKKRLRQRCFELQIDVDHVFDTVDGPQSSIELVPRALFFKTMAAHGLALDEREKELVVFFCSPSGLVSLPSFFHFLDVQKPKDHIDPDLAFAQLPQPFRMLAKLLDDDVFDRAWLAITSSMTYKLQQGQLNADMQEREAKARRCHPTTLVQVAIATPSPLNAPIFLSGDRELVALVHDGGAIELLHGTTSQVLLPKTPLFPGAPRLQVQCLSQLKPVRMGNTKATFVAAAAWKRGKPLLVEGQAEPPPDPVLDALESLVHIYATTGTALTLRMTLPLKERAIGLTLADDAAFLAVQMEGGNVDVYATQALTAEIESQSVVALDATKSSLHVDPTSYRIFAPPKAAAVDAAVAAPPVKGDKHKEAKGKGNKDHVEDAPPPPPAPVVYATFLYVAFLASSTPFATTTGLVLASQHKLLQFRLPSPTHNGAGAVAPTDAPANHSPEASVVVSAPITCATLDSTSTLVVLGLENGCLVAWHTRLHVEHSGIGLHSTPVAAVSLFKMDCLVSLSRGNEAHFHTLRHLRPASTRHWAPPSQQSLVRVCDGLAASGSPFASLCTLHDVPMTFLAQADGTVTIYDTRTAEIIGSLVLADGGDSVREFRGLTTTLPLGAGWVVSGDQLYIPIVVPIEETSDQQPPTTTEAAAVEVISPSNSSSSVGSTISQPPSTASPLDPSTTADVTPPPTLIGLCVYTAASIWQTSFPHHPPGLATNWRTLYMERHAPHLTISSTAASSSAGSGPPSTSMSSKQPIAPQTSSSHVAPRRHPSTMTPTPSTADLKAIAADGCVVASSCSIGAPAPPPPKCVQSIYLAVLQRHGGAAAVERDLRMAKRRSDVLKTLNTMW